MKFIACKHLDYDTEYSNCKRQVLGSGHVFWLRDVEPDLPRMVQFCKLRGRINSPQGCTCKQHAHCSEYEDSEHEVDDASIAP